MGFNAADFLLTTRDVLKLLGRRVRERRISMRFSQVDLARRAGLSRDTVVRIEHGANVGTEALVRVATILKATTEFGTLFPAYDARSFDEILAAQRPLQRVRSKRQK